MTQPTQLPVIEQPMLEQIATVASEPDAEHPITANQAAAVIAAYHNIITAGDPVGTIRRDPATGAVAVKADVDGLLMWRVSVPDGTQYNDLQPTLDWPEL